MGRSKLNPAKPISVVNKKGRGRPIGSKGKTTSEIRNMVKDIVENQLENIDETLERLREKDAYKYMSILTRLAELVLPRQAEYEITNQNGIDINATITAMKEKLNQKEEYKTPEVIETGEKDNQFVVTVSNE